MSEINLKEHFKEYRQIIFQIEEIETKLLLKRRKLTGPQSPKYNDVHFPPMSETQKIELISEIDNLEKKLDELRGREEILYNKHLKEIELVPNDNSRRVLRSIYLYQMSYEDIAEMMSLSYQTIRNVKVKGEKALVNALRER